MQYEVTVKIVCSLWQYIVIVLACILSCFNPTNIQYTSIVHGNRLLKGHAAMVIAIMCRVGAFRTRTNAVTVPLHFRRGGGDHHAEQGAQAQGQGQE